MYYYIYDSTAQSKEASKEIARIESRLLDFGIRDKTVKLTPLKSVRDAVADAYTSKFDTIIAVGGDSLILAIIKFLVGYPMVLGTVPLGEQTLIAKLLGIPYGAASCEVISARKISQIPIGKADEEFFFSTFECKEGLISFRIDDSFTVTPAHASFKLAVTNIGTPPLHYQIQKTNKLDGKLLVVLEDKKTGVLAKIKQKEPSVWRAKTVELTLGTNFLLFFDGMKSPKKIQKIQSIPSALRCIVGKDRVF